VRAGERGERVANLNVEAVPPEVAAKSFEVAKKEREEVLFKKWIKADKTADGWAMSYEGPRLDETPGSLFLFSVRRKIDGKAYDCYGSSDNQADLPAAIDICASLRAL
jgi:hypothetical protein